MGARSDGTQQTSILPILGAARKPEELRTLTAEHNVLGKRPDILASGIDENGEEGPVCIENQYGMSDAGHLGRLIASNSAPRRWVRGRRQRRRCRVGSRVPGAQLVTRFDCTPLPLPWLTSLRQPESQAGQRHRAIPQITPTDGSGEPFFYRALGV